MLLAGQGFGAVESKNTHRFTAMSVVLVVIESCVVNLYNNWDTETVNYSRSVRCKWSRNFAKSANDNV